MWWGRRAWGERSSSPSLCSSHTSSRLFRHSLLFLRTLRRHRAYQPLHQHQQVGLRSTVGRASLASSSLMEIEQSLPRPFHRLCLGQKRARCSPRHLQDWLPRLVLPQPLRTTRYAIGPSTIYIRLSILLCCAVASYTLPLSSFFSFLIFHFSL